MTWIRNTWVSKECKYGLYGLLSRIKNDEVILRKRILEEGWVS